MRIMLFSRICAKTGVGNHIRQLAEELVKQGHCVFVVSSTNEQGIKEKENLSFIRLPFTSKNPLTCIKNLKALNIIIKDNKIDIVHCHHRVAALYMKLYRMLWCVPMVYTLHSAPIPHDFIHRKLTFVGDMGIGVSTEVSQFMEMGLKIPKSKVTTVLNGVIPPDENLGGVQYEQELRRKFAIPDNKYVILLNSRIDEVKNHLIMVEAVKELPQSIKERIVVACTGKQEGEYYLKVKEKIKEYSLSEQFIFVGWVNPYEILAVSDFLMLPSFAEGFPLNVIEAFFMKVPCARTATGGWEDYMDFCLLINPDSTKEIIELITWLVSEGKELFEEQINGAFRFATENLTVSQMTGKTLEIYRIAMERYYGKSRRTPSTGENS